MTIDQAIYILKNTAWLGSNDKRDETERAVETVINELERRRWIPCSEGLPEEKKEVLISADGDLCIAEYETNHGRGYWSEVVEYRNVTDVDAWMPLPKQYGGEQE